MTATRALRLDGFGDPPLVDLVDVELGPLAHGEARLRLLAAELLPLDRDIAIGVIPAEVANGLQPGTTAIAEVIEGPDVGARVAVQGGAFGLGLLRPGTFAEVFDAPSQALHHVPASLPTDVAAAGFSNLVAAHLALQDVAGLRSGETVVVLGASGGFGRAAAALAVEMGATVITVTRKPRRADEVDGATPVGLFEVGTAVEQLTDGNGADVILDPLGGAITSQVAALGGDGCRHVLVGSVAGRDLQLRTTQFLAREHRLLGLNAFLANGRRLREVTDEALTDLARGTGLPRIGPHYDLDEAPAAFSQVGGSRVLFVPEGA